MNQNEKSALQLTANTIRALSIDAIAAANSGHPGLPLGCAELGAYLYGKGLNHNPKEPNWINRDRFILSAGHGSMLLYSCLHLSGFEVSLEDLKNFRKLGAPTAGHPEYHELPGVETTTGPLGQGLATAVGIALGQKTTQARTGLNLDNHTIVLVGDGCIMEGITSEASALAGHLALDNLIVIYDSNDICLDGPTSETHTENTQKRYEAYGWKVQTIDGHDLDAIHAAFRTAKAEKGAPQLIIAKTKIGKGSPTYEGSSEVHGKPLEKEEIQRTKEALGISLDPFFVPEAVKTYFQARLIEQHTQTQSWNLYFKDWYSINKTLWDSLSTQQIPETLDATLKALEIKPGLATRASSSAVLQAIHDHVPAVIGGSADLSCSDSTYMKKSGSLSKTDFSQRNIKYGVREFAMGAMASGLRLQGNSIPFCGTFLTFSDYMKNAIRLAALMKLKVIYQFTHDSIFLGEDGPTHQPVEHLASLRSIPGLTVIRPADSTEVKAAWSIALQNEGPTALILSRQGLPELPNVSFEDTKKGAYIIRKESTEGLDLILLATGSEVSLALEVAKDLETAGKSVRVISFPSWELFESQSSTYQKELMPNTCAYAVIEAQSSFGWHKYIGKNGICLTVDTFGKSGNAADLAKDYKLTKEACIQKINSFF